MFRFSLLLLAVSLCGCVSKSVAQLQAREAFLAGQQQAMARMQTKPTTVTVHGEVKKREIPWTKDMSVAKAICEAEYTGFATPKTIYVVHEGKATQLSASDLLRGEDVKISAGDIIEIQ